MHKNGARCSLQYQPKQAEIRPNFVYHAQPPVAQCPFDPGIIYIDANTDHSYHKLGDKECVSVWVYASPHATPMADSFVL